MLLSAAVVSAINPVPVYMNTTADVFILQSHFEVRGSGYLSLDAWLGQLRQYRDQWGVGLLPATILWRVPPTSIRGTGKFPPLDDHITCIKASR